MVGRVLRHGPCPEPVGWYQHCCDDFRCPEHCNACLEGLARELGVLLAGRGGESNQADSGCQG